jgi:hypothetical protein
MMTNIVELSGLLLLLKPIVALGRQRRQTRARIVKLPGLESIRRM